MPALQAVTVWAAGEGRRGGGLGEGHRTHSGEWGSTCPPSVPISCELPHMKGRNWKSSRPHTPWLPAGSILYVFWSFRITSRYLHRRMGKRGEAAEVKKTVPLEAQGSRKQAPKNVPGLYCSENLHAQVTISWYSQNTAAFFFTPTLSLLLAQERGKPPPGKGSQGHQLRTT